MRNKRKQKKRSVVRSAKDNYERGMDLCLNEDYFDTALKYLLRAQNQSIDQPMVRLE